MMRVNVSLFARAREAYGAGTVQVQLNDSATPGDCFDALATESPGLAALRGCLLIAVNERYARWDAALADGDEVAFIPPVSGG